MDIERQYIHVAAEGARQARETQPDEEQPDSPADHATETVYALLAEKGITVDRAIVDVTEAKRILASSFGVAVVMPYNYTGPDRQTRRSPLYSSTEVNLDAVEAICQFMETKGSLKRALRELPGMPTHNVFFAWVGRAGAARDRYARAREGAAVRLANEIEDVGQNLLADPNPTRERIAAAKVAIDALTWQASKLGPAVYGDARAARLSEIKDSFVKALERVEEKARRIEKQGSLTGPVIDVTPETAGQGRAGR